MSKKLIALLLALVMVVALAACGQQAAPAAAPAAEPAASGSGLIKVGVVNNPPSESGYREANVNDFISVFTEPPATRLIFDSPLCRSHARWMSP